MEDYIITQDKTNPFPFSDSETVASEKQERKKKNWVLQKQKAEYIDTATLKVKIIWI